MDSKQCCLYGILFACDDSELFGVKVGVKMVNIVYSFSWLLQRTIFCIFANKVSVKVFELA